jgi:hypothetical protein
MSVGQQDRDQNAGESGWQPQPQQPPVQPKKHHRVRTTVLASVGLVAALIVTVSLTGGSKSASPNDSISSPSPAASAPAVPVAPPTNDPGDITDDTLDEPSTMALGDAAEITSEDGENGGTIEPSKLRISTTPYDSYGSGPAEKYFLIFTVKLRAEADGFDTAGDDFYVKTGSGERVSTDEGNSYDAVDYDKTMGYEELNDGEHVTKLLVFDSPSKHGTLNYSPNYEGGPIATWTF